MAAPLKSESTPNGTEERHEEYQYLDLVREILENGEHRPDRTGTGTYAIFAPRPLKFSLNRAGTPILPLLTTKRVFTKAVIAELLWFVGGGTSSAPLSAQGVKIWDGNGSREFLDSRGLTHRAVGDLGPVYGFQWRHFGAEYVDADADYSGKGVDQLADVIRKLRHTPYDRRMILSAWNPRDLHLMALPPCHMFAQFYVSYPRKKKSASAAANCSNGSNGATGTSNGTSTASASAEEAEQQPPPPTEVEKQEQEKEQGHLHCQLYQRSCDMGLGVPFNIASYALLTHMLAHVCGLVPGSLTHVMGDAHVYVDHVDALRVQLGRVPSSAFPELEIARPAPSEAEEERTGVSGIDGWRLEDFVIRGYDPQKAIPMKMSV